MQRKVVALFASLLGFTLAARPYPRDVGSWTPHHPNVDNSTYANVDEVRVTHQHADWFPNFAQ